MYTIKDLYDLDHTLAKEYLEGFTYPWEALKGIKNMIIELGKKLDKEEYDEVIKYALEIGVTQAFVQDEGTAEESFIPDFNTNVL